MNIHYPDYVPDWRGSRGRDYPSEEELQETNPHLKNLSPKERKKLQRHHIDLDRMNGDPENMHVIDDKTHDGVHREERALSSQMIKKGIVAYDRENPHYYVADSHTRDVLKGLAEPMGDVSEDFIERG